jgi:polysaccharide biosynthesis transport protein
MPDELDQMLSSVEDYWAIAQRRRWWILLSVFFSWAAVWGISWTVPSTFQSEALILLEQQNVPNQYVEPNVNASVQDRLQTLSQQVLSRTRLQATIDRFHLYPAHHGLMAIVPSGDPIERLRKDIEIELVPAPGHPNEFSAFKLRYTAESPELARQVNTELTSPFVNENVEAQQQLSEETTSFLENQLADARTKMEEQEAKVAAFKAKHIGELPSQMQMNGQQILTAIQAQLQNTHQALESARQQRLYLESLLRQYQSAQANPGGDAIGNGSANGIADSPMTRVNQLEKELMNLRLRLQDLQERYTDDYPDVVAMKDKIEKKEKQKELAENEGAANPGRRKTANSAISGVTEEAQNGSPTSLKQIESQLKANQLEIENDQKRESDLESQISAYLARLNMVPEAEQELANISRGYEESKANYNSLLQKQMQSQLATSLEERQKGEQFRILDPPSLPNKHLTPNRFKFSVGGLALGFVLGFGFVALLELTDIRVRQEKDIKTLVQVPLLVSIPRLSTQSEEEVHARVRWFDYGAVMIILTLLAIGNVFAFYKR